MTDFPAGMVWLVGAGPDDPELMTRKAERLLRPAVTLHRDHSVTQYGNRAAGFRLPLTAPRLAPACRQRRLLPRQAGACRGAGCKSAGNWSRP